jgi:hypothetical protein
LLSATLPKRALLAYPFVQTPTLDEFVKLAQANGCQEHHFGGTITGPRGAASIRCLKGNRNVIVILPNIASDQRLTPTVLRSLCNQLALDPKLFGLTSG